MVGAAHQQSADIDDSAPTGFIPVVRPAIAPGSPATEQQAPAVGPSATAAAIRRLLVGKVPNPAWLNHNVPANPGYQGVSTAGQAYGVRDFTPTVRDRVLDANATHFHNNPGLLQPAPVHPGAAVHAPASDQSRTQLYPAAHAKLVNPEVDHSIPFSEWGSNDPRNARVLNYTENRTPGIPRPLPNDIDVIAMQADGELGVNPGAVLNVAQINQLLDRSETAHVAQTSAMQPAHFQAILEGDQDDDDQPRRGRKKKR